MCTCLNWINDRNCYFGRTLDNPLSFDQKIVITPRNYPIFLACLETVKHHYAVMGVATIVDDYPLYADGVNEHGLCMAGLQFLHDTHYFPYNDKKTNITPYEFILYILATCKNVKEAKELLSKTNLVDFPFSKEIPLAPLHWMISDAKESIVVESTITGLNVYDNPFNSLTNNPPFPYHRENINNYLTLSNKYPSNNFAKSLSLKPYGEGMGCMFLPGDFSPSSRFVRSVFLMYNSTQFENEDLAVLQFFKIMGSVSLLQGAVYTKNDQCDFTHYTSCINSKKGIYYYRTYENTSINAINMNNENLSSKELISYKLIKTTDIFYQN